MTDYETLSQIAENILDEADDDMDSLVRLLSLQESAVLNELLDSDLLNAYQVFYYFFRCEPSELVQDILMLEPATSLRYGIHIDDCELAEIYFGVIKSEPVILITDGDKEIMRFTGVGAYTDAEKYIEENLFQ